MFAGKRGRILAAFSAVLLVAVSLAGCGKANPAAAQYDGAANTVGNTPGNLANGGIAAIQGDRIYYSIPGGKNCGLYTVKTDGTGKVKLCGYSAVSGINVVGNRIYFYQDQFGGGVYTMKTDGSGRRRLSSDWPNTLAVVDGRIYYSIGERDSTDGVYSTDLNGRNKKKLYDDAAYRLSVVDDRIYFGAVGAIYSMKTDGSDRRAVYSDPADAFYNTIYYPQASGGRIYVSVIYYQAHSMALDGSDWRSYDFTQLAGLNVQGDTMYFNDAVNLCTMKTDGTGRRVLYATKYAWIFDIDVVDGWLYCVADTGDGSTALGNSVPGDSHGTLYRVRTDGTGWQQVS